LGLSGNYLVIDMPMHRSKVTMPQPYPGDITSGPDRIHPSVLTTFPPTAARRGGDSFFAQ